MDVSWAFGAVILLLLAELGLLAAAIAYTVWWRRDRRGMASWLKEWRDHEHA